MSSDKASESARSAPDLAGLASRLNERGLPPVHQWDPPFCGDMDLRIARDGTWYYHGSPIGRRRLVKLLSTVLRRDSDEEYYLVTPVEKLRIRVDDAPFVAVELERDRKGGQQRLLFRTNVDDIVIAGPENRIWVNENPSTREPSPYIGVRGGLNALIARPVYYQIVDIAETRDDVTGMELFVRSLGEEFTLGRIS